MQRESLLDLGEAARLHDIADEVGTNLGRPAPQLAQPPGRDVDADSPPTSSETTMPTARKGRKRPKAAFGASSRMKLGAFAELLSTCATAIHQRDRRDDLGRATRMMRP